MSETDASLDARHAMAVQLALEAGALAQGMRQSLGPLAAKSAIDFCTEADRAVEQLILGRVATEFGDATIGEEEGGDPTDSVWVVDPIDGTAGYIHGDDRWCISIAYVRARRLEIGVIYAPAEDRLFTARSGAPALLNGRPLAVSFLRHGAAPVIEVGWSERRPLADYCAVLQGLDAIGCEFRRRGSGALALTDVARGASDGYVELHINAWDALAGLLLVRQAGGRTNDFLAGDGLTHGNLLIASTPEVYQRLATVTGQVGYPAEPPA
jgi:myo-inositol-1(or 4)-monophosphatase